MKILIADDHPIVRSSMKAVLAVLDGYAEFFEAGSFAEAATVLAQNKGIELVLLDLMMPDMDPLGGLKHIVRRARKAPVVIVSATQDRRDALAAIDLGARGFIPKTVAHDEFVRLVRFVLGGGLCLPQSVSGKRHPKGSRANRMPAGIGHHELLSRLTTRQRQVLALLAQGKSNQEIAADLHLSDKTIRYYISTILKAFNVKNRTQAALVVTRNMENQPPLAPILVPA